MKVRQWIDNQVLMDEQTFNRRTHPSLEYTLRISRRLALREKKAALILAFLWIFILGMEHNTYMRNTNVHHFFRYMDTSLRLHLLDSTSLL